MLRRLLYPILPERRVWVTHVAALTAAGFVSLCAFMMNARSLMQQAKLRVNEQVHNLPAESVCLTPYTVEYRAPETMTSRRPVLRLREYAPHRYELLYWGNPVRPRYAFSVMSLATGSSALLGADGRSQRLRSLPVSVPARKDRKLPLQPTVRLDSLAGREGNLYAARISVHDADKGTVLCTELYIISGTQPR